MTSLFRFLERGIFVIHELCLHARKSSYEFCPRVESLPADAHRIVALSGMPLMSSRLWFRELFCALHGTVDVRFNFLVLHNFFKFPKIVRGQKMCSPQSSGIVDLRLCFCTMSFLHLLRIS